MRRETWEWDYPQGCEECPVPDGCDELRHVQRLGGYVSQCPWKAMQEHPEVATAASEAIRAWRLGQVGALSVAYPDASDCLLQLVLLVDNEVAAYREEIMEQERRRIEQQSRSRGGRR